jgi:zinc/manganese transport system substrate-binding protein
MRSLILVGITLLAGCNAAVPPPAGAPKLRVVTTFSVIDEFARTVGGDRIELTNLVGPDGDAHTFEPTPADAAKLANADLILENGLGFEGHWLDKAYSAGGAKGYRHAVSFEVKRIATNGEPDPHAWHSIAAAATYVKQIALILGTKDPANRAYYADNAASYLGELTALDVWVKEQVRTLPADRRKLVTSHDTFAYFARDYGFTVVGTVLPTSTAAEDPSAADFARLVERVRSEKVPAVFCEASHNPKLIDRLAKEAGVVVGPTLYTDALGAAGSPGGTYSAMVRHNVTAIVTSLSK